MVLFGRNSESPVPVVAASTPAGCFDAAIEAARIAVKYRTPVFLLSDAYLANGSEPWLIPDVDALPDIDDGLRDRAERRRDLPPVPARRRDARAAVGGSGHARGSSTASAASRRRTRPGNVSYDPENHDLMVRLRAAKVAGHRGRHPRARGRRSRTGADTLVLGWGSTYGAIGAAARRVRASGRKVATAHLHHLNPFPRNTGEVRARATTRCSSRR